MSLSQPVITKQREHACYRSILRGNPFHTGDSVNQTEIEFEHRIILQPVLLKRSKTQDFAGKLDSKKM